MEGDVNLKLSDREDRFGIIEEDSDLPAQDAKDGSQPAASGDLLDPSPVPLVVSPTPAAPRRPSPAGNALQHGLAATTFLPDTLRLRTDHLAAELRRELRPVGAVQFVLVDEIARHAAGMELAGDAEGAILRYCGQQQAQLDLLLDGDGPINADAIVTAAVSSQPLERLCRYRRGHERGFHAALSRLRDLQATRQESHIRAQFARFRDEHVCREYLRERARQSVRVCPRCGDRHGHWLARLCWECSACGVQLGLRWGSVMEGSRLPLRTWFKAIGEVLAEPAIRPQHLKQVIDVPRLGTVRRLLRKIIAAIESPDVDRLLVGLQDLGPRAFA